MEQLKPSIGRIVHFGFVEVDFVDDDPNMHRVVRCAAIVTDVSQDGDVLLHPFHPQGRALLNEGSEWRKYSPELEANCWTWPPRAT